VIKLFFCSLGSVFQRLHHLTSMEYCWARLMQPPFVLSHPGGAVHRRPPSPTGYQSGAFKKIVLPYTNVPTSTAGVSSNKGLITGFSGYTGFIATCK